MALYKVYLPVELDLTVTSLSGTVVVRRHLGVQNCLIKYLLKLFFSETPYISNEGLTCLCHFIFKSVTSLYRQLPNMSKNSAAYEKNVEHAVLKLLKHPGLSIPTPSHGFGQNFKEGCNCQWNHALGHAPGHAPGSKATLRPCALTTRLRDNNNETFSIQCNNQLDNDVITRQLWTF